MTEENVQRKFFTALNSILSRDEGLIDNCRLAQETLCNCTALDVEIAMLVQEIELLEMPVRESILATAGEKSAKEGIPGLNIFYIQKHDSAFKRRKELEGNKKEKQNRKVLLDGFIRNIEESGKSIGEFDERLWTAVTERVNILQHGALMFSFKDITEITIGEE